MHSFQLRMQSRASIKKLKVREVLYLARNLEELLLPIDIVRPSLQPTRATASSTIMLDERVE